MAKSTTDDFRRVMLKAFGQKGEKDAQSGPRE